MGEVMLADVFAAPVGCENEESRSGIACCSSDAVRDLDWSVM